MQEAECSYPWQWSQDLNAKPEVLQDAVQGPDSRSSLSTHWTDAQWAHASVRYELELNMKMYVNCRFHLLALALGLSLSLSMAIPAFAEDC